MEDNLPEIASPCTKVCKIDINLGLCTGCFRTLTEIASWSAMTNDEKQRILNRIEANRKTSADE